MSDSEKLWMEGRTRPVRVYLTEDEHALVRQAAANADKSVSRFSVESIVAAARAAKPVSAASMAPAKPGRKRAETRRGGMADTDE